MHPFSIRHLQIDFAQVQLRRITPDCTSKSNVAICMYNKEAYIFKKLKKQPWISAISSFHEYILVRETDWTFTG